MGLNTKTYLADYSDFEDCGLYIGDTGKMFHSPGKKLKNIYWLLYTNENLTLSQYTAQKGKSDHSDIKRFNENILENLDALWEMLRYETYEPGEYRIKKIYDPKERDIMIAPFFPDRIIHHCLVNVLGPHWNHIFIANTYSCIKGRGTHKCRRDVGEALKRDKHGTRYCLKIDIRKFYDNIDHAALKRIFRYTIADEQLLRLLDKIVDSNGKEKGLPIGNYTSQYFANLYLAYFDHWMKEAMGVKYYFRYMDDIAVLDGDKDRLHYLLDMMGLYLATELKVEIKPNWQIFPVDDRGIDFVGYKQDHFGVLLRKSILNKFYKKADRIACDTPIRDATDIKHLFPSEYGWVIGCSEQHKENVFNIIISKNGNNKNLINRAVG